MNHIQVTVGQAPSYSSNWSWHAIAIINGKRTTCTCRHSHKSEALAIRCANGKFALEVARFTNAELVPLDNGAIEARWTDEQGRLVTSRFRFTKPVSADA